MLLSELKFKFNISNGTQKSVCLISVNGAVEKEMHLKLISLDSNYENIMLDR